MKEREGKTGVKDTIPIYTPLETHATAAVYHGNYWLVEVKHTN